MKVEDMKGGYTTGSCATAGMKAGLLALLDKNIVDQVVIENPQGQYIEVPIKAVEVISDTEAKVTVMKDGGDDPDVTHGNDVETTVTLDDTGELRFRAGFGVGTVTKPGLAMPPGEPAINPGPRTMMKLVFEEHCVHGQGVTVTVSVPNGKVLANSLVPQLKVMKANGCETAVLVPGRIGQDLAEQVLGIHKNQMAETSNFIGFMLEKAVQIGFKRILIIGHIGKLIKLASGSFHTHNRMSDGRMESIVAYAALEGASQEVCEELFNCQTTESTFPILEREGLTGVYQRVVDRASLRSERYIANEAEVGIIITTLKGEILAMDKHAKEIGELEHWHIPCIS
ncbi:MAG: cobalt-precorrin-5B (C(1))-methyltransferase [Veillonella sp.]|nr:cobalt-precorrin-5B (C(1))-methyltransferase [Veillonella sp.]